MVGIGIVGCGSIVRMRHAPECSKNPNAVIKGFYNRSTGRAEEMVQNYGGRVYTSLDELMKDPEVEAIIVATPNNSHMEISIMALESGKHVLCEKPCVVNMKELKKLEAAVACSEKVFMAAQNQRFLEVHIKAKELYKKGEIGKGLSFWTEFSHSGPEGWSVEGENTWFLEKERSVLGVLGDLGIHKIDLMRWLLETNVKMVGADLKNLHKKQRREKALGMSDYAVCQLEMKNGIEGTVISSWCNYGKCRNQTVIYGTEGVMVIDPEAEREQILAYKKDERKVWTCHCQGNSQVVDAFVKAIVEGSGSASPVGIFEVAEDMKVIFAAEEADRFKRWIALEETINDKSKNSSTCGKTEI